MAIPNYSLNHAGFKAPGPQPPGDDLTDKEALLTTKFGNLHQFIPTKLNSGMTQEALAAHMGVSAAFISKWLKTNGYVGRRRWERK